MPRNLALLSSALLILFALACSSSIDTLESDNPEGSVQSVGAEQSQEIPGETDLPNSDSLDPTQTTGFDPAGRGGRGSGFVVLDNPTMIEAAQATWLDADEIVLGVEQNDEAQAFPISQMAYHHIANTTVGGEPYLVTY